MSLPSVANLSTLDFAWNGLPYCVIAAHNGTPFYGFNPTGAEQTGITPATPTTTLRTIAELSTLNYGWNAMPFCVVAAPANLDTKTLDYGWNGMPFTYAPSRYVAVSVNVGNMMMIF